MSFTSDCNLRDVISRGHGPLCTCRHMHKHINAQRHRCMHGCNSLKSLSREVYSHERSTVHKANATLHSGTSKPSAGLHTSPRIREFLDQIIHSPPRNWNEATPCNGGPHRGEGWPFTRYIGTLYTIRIRMTVV